MEWIMAAILTVLAIVLHSPSGIEKTESKKRQDISTKC